MNYYIYIIVNKVNFKTYVGQRKSDKKWNEDHYMGSGKHLRSAQKGRKISEEHKRKLSEAHKGQKKGMHWKLVDGKRIYF